MSCYQVLKFTLMSCRILIGPFMLSIAKIKLFSRSFEFLYDTHLKWFVAKCLIWNLNRICCFTFFSRHKYDSICERFFSRSMFFELSITHKMYIMCKCQQSVKLTFRYFLWRNHGNAHSNAIQRRSFKCWLLWLNHLSYY